VPETHIDPKKAPAIGSAVAAAALCAALGAAINVGTLTLFIAALLAFMLSRRTPTLTTGRALVAGLLVGLAAGVLDAGTGLAENFLLPRDLAGPYGSFEDLMASEEALARTAFACCGTAFAHPVLGLAGAWFGRTLGPTDNG
jgi:hypothetical protein